jgi:hypothetical protein
MGFAWAPADEWERDALLPSAGRWPPAGPWPGGLRDAAGRHAGRRHGSARHQGRHVRATGPDPGANWLSYFHRK